MPQDEIAYIALRKYLLTGEFSAEEKLVEIPLAQRLGVGRAAIRTALRRLAGEGLVSKVRASYRALKLSSEDVRELRQMREILEIGALRVAGKISGQSLDAIKQCCDDYEQFVSNGYFEGAREADLRFHASIVAVAGNARLTQLYQLSNLPLFQTRIGQGGGMLEDYDLAMAEHRQILNALITGETEQAVRALEAHLRRGESEVIGRADGMEPNKSAPLSRENS